MVLNAASSLKGLALYFFFILVLMLVFIFYVAWSVILDLLLFTERRLNGMLRFKRVPKKIPKLQVPYFTVIEMFLC